MKAFLNFFITASMPSAVIGPVTYRSRNSSGISGRSGSGTAGFFLLLGIHAPSHLQHVMPYTQNSGHSRRGNCYDNAVAESFFQLLKRERIRRRIYGTREEGRRDVFDYIEMFYNPKRRHGYNNRLSPVDYEKQYFE